MTKTYSYELSKKDLTKLQNDLNRIPKILSSTEFKEYLGDKLKEALRFIQRNLLTTVNNDLAEQLSNYMNSNHLEIEGDTIYIYNDAVINISKKNMKPTTKINYPAQLSLAKIVEYGIGYTGLKNTKHQEEVEDWTYDMNNHGYKGWYYTDVDGSRHWTNGYEGRMIFYHLKEFVKLNAEKWIIDYMNKEL